MNTLILTAAAALFAAPAAAQDAAPEQLVLPGATLAPDRHNPIESA